MLVYDSCAWGPYQLEPAGGADCYLWITVVVCPVASVCKCMDCVLVDGECVPGVQCTRVLCWRGCHVLCPRVGGITVCGVCMYGESVTSLGTNLIQGLGYLCTSVCARGAGHAVCEVHDLVYSSCSWYQTWWVGLSYQLHRSRADS